MTRMPSGPFFFIIFPLQIAIPPDRIDSTQYCVFFLSFLFSSARAPRQRVSTRFSTSPLKPRKRSNTSTVFPPFVNEIMYKYVAHPQSIVMTKP
ncbi:hypothetical protein LZ31DRAFT_270410 [Colletotrichum somersetense]|nr:hypothetical protein LZ31DRAFT_270410 [Colletotrichum somersetense]